MKVITKLKPGYRFFWTTLYTPTHKHLNSLFPVLHRSAMVQPLANIEQMEQLLPRLAKATFPYSANTTFFGGPVSVLLCIIYELNCSKKHSQAYAPTISNDDAHYASYSSIVRIPPWAVACLS